MAKKTLWAVAGLAVVAILVFVYFNGTRSVDQGVEGTIAAANRAVGAQPASVNAAGSDVDAFLQSDTFNKILKNKELRSLLGDANFASAFRDVSIQAAMMDPVVQRLVSNRLIASAFASVNVQSAMGDARVAAALGSPTVASALQNEQVKAVINSAAFQAALNDPSARLILAGPAFQTALADAVKLSGQANVKAGANLNAAFASAIQGNAKLVALTSDANFQAALGRMASLFGDAAFQASLNGQMAKLMTDVAFQAALKPQAGIGTLFGNAAFQAACRNTALQGPQANVTGASFRNLVNLIADARFNAAMQDVNFQNALNSSAFAAALGTAKFQSALSQQ